MVGIERNKLIGITGGIGSGKSYICRGLRELGYPVYDTDSRAKELMVHDLCLRTEIIDLLGPEAYDGDRYRTEYVGPLVFSHPELLEALNRLVHPAVCRDVETWAKDKPLAFVESAILFESGLAARCDKTVCVDAPLEIRIARAMRRDHADRERIEARIRAQKDESARCTQVIHNDGSTPLPQLLEQILQN